MNRRAFLSYIGLGAATLAIDPKLLVADPVLDIATDYPELSFTGFKSTYNSHRVAGQFLWSADYSTLAGESKKAFWYCNVVMDLAELKMNKSVMARGELIRFKFQSGVLEVARMMDEIIVIAKSGRIQTPNFVQVPNPEFNPCLPECVYPEDDEVYNPKYIDDKSQPIFDDIQSFKFTQPFDDLRFDVEDIDRYIVRELMRFEGVGV